MPEDIRRKEWQEFVESQVWQGENEHTKNMAVGVVADWWSAKIEEIKIEEKQKIIKAIQENLSDDYEFSYDSSIDITEIPDEVWQELETMKKSIKGTKEFIISLIK